MDLSGRGPAYRGGTARCPSCGEPMQTEPLSRAEVDVCPACGGMWVDWFDGDLEAIAIEAERGRVARGTPLPRALRQPVATRCPRCSQALSAELYRFGDARDDELVSGVEVFRCADCAGAFVPRSAAHLLLDRTKQAPTMTLWELIWDGDVIDWLRAKIERRGR